MKKTSLPALLVLALTSLYWVSVTAGIATTKHNLSVTGPGSVKATSESEICIFCHTPHNSTPSGPLWNRRDPGGTYTPYSSTSIATSPGNPTGDSILCLSCHDGTIALGELNSRLTNVDISGGPNMPAGPTNLTQDLSDDHPISFSYSNSQSAKPSDLVPPSTLTGAVKLDSNGQLQCTSCHNAHEDKFGKFLVKSPIAGALCLTCHIKTTWSASSHSTSSQIWNGDSVANNACQSCHVPHSANGKARLLRNQVEEDVCFTCHDGSVAALNIQSEFNKFSRHPVFNTTGIHDPIETAVVNNRHVECIDCHNPHAAKANGTPSGPLTAVRGVNTNGNQVDPITQEYQLCYRCHADSSNKPAPPTTRQFNETNVRLEFLTSNPSYHPVTGTAADTNSPSLTGMPFPSGSIIKCTNCHNNDNTNGPNGPHGSIYPQLLTRQYLTQDNTTESASSYALCYGCHSRTSILGNQTFPLHNKHIQGENAPCNACHDPHGSQQARLINFDTSIVSQSSSGRLEYNSNGPGTESGECYLSCHGKNHNPCTYGSGMGGMGCRGGGGGGG